MLNDRYGDLLDKVMNKKRSDIMIDTSAKMGDLIIEKRKREERQHEQVIAEREEKERTEQKRIQRSNDFAEHMIEKAKIREQTKEAKRERILKEKHEEQERRERHRKTIENLNWGARKIVCEQKLFDIK